MKVKEKRKGRLERHKRVRRKVHGTGEMPRLSVYRSLKHIYAQLINDDTGETLLSVSTRSKDLKEKLDQTGNISASKEVGLLLAKKALEKGYSEVVFDRGGYLFHGRVRALAEGAREGGLKF